MSPLTSRPSPRPIRRLLVANRGEIATRILNSARELDIETFAVYTADDTTHTHGAAHSVKLSSPSSYLDIAELVSVAKEHAVDAVHPGYGFLSESTEFALKMWEAGVAVVGPGWDILAQTGDKLQAKKLAEQAGVPVLAALESPTNNIGDLRAFATHAGYPIMVKAVDGGGGRGIRLVRSEEELEAAAKRAIEESPSRQVFAEKAAVDGYLHVEVQIVGDGRNVEHLWERQCSIQRRYQKVVEIAPCITPKRAFVENIIQSAVRMAKRVKYFSLGTFEFLANPTTEEFYFLEVNPRLQVEHTITESISSVDLVRAQLLLAQGATLEEAGIRRNTAKPLLFSCQLRITAENASDWSLSIGRIQSFQLPSGNGIRVDTNLLNGHASVVSSDFDSLLAKVIVTAPSWPEVVRKCQRALQDTHISGVKTNLNILRGIVAHPDFVAGDCDTRWLETNHAALLAAGDKLTAAVPALAVSQSVGLSASAAAAPIFRPGDAWTLSLSAPGKEPRTAHLQLARLLRNEFPAALSANFLYSTATEQTVPLTVSLASTSASAGAATSTHRRGDPANPKQVVIPFPGKLVEVLVDVGDVVKEGDVICVVQQMKMELEVRAGRSGKVTWLLEAEDGEDVGEGVLAAELDVDGREAKL